RDCCGSITSCTSSSCRSTGTPATVSGASRPGRSQRMTPVGKAEQFDAIVIGCGPAGSAAAAVLAETGRRVLVLERETFPRSHIGESLLPFTYSPLQTLGLVERV